MRTFFIFIASLFTVYAASVTQVPLMVSTNGVIKFPTNLTVMGHLAWGTNAPLTVPSLTTTQRDALTGTNGMLIYNTSNTRFERYEAGSWTTFAGGSGEANTASNLGTNSATVQGLFSAKSGVDLQFRSIVAGTGISLSSNASTVTIEATSSGGTVTSVALTAPSMLSVSGSPITGSGTLALSLANQNANTVFAGPTSGGAAAPTFRALVSGDIPDLSATYFLAASTNLLTDTNTFRTFTNSLGTAAFTASSAYQPVDSELTAIAALTSSANTMIYFTGSGAAQLTDISSQARQLLDDNNTSTMRTTLGLAIGSDVQAYDADLTTWAGITPSANVQTLLSAADYSAFRTSLGVAIGVDVQAYDADLSNWALLSTNMLRTITNNINVYVTSAPATNVVDLSIPTATNILEGALTILHATNGATSFEQTHVRWFWAGGADRALTIPSGWKTNVNSAVPANITNGTITKMYVTSIGDTGSSANQTNVFVSFEFYK